MGHLHLVPMPAGVRVDLTLLAAATDRLPSLRSLLHVLGMREQEVDDEDDEEDSDEQTNTGHQRSPPVVTDPVEGRVYLVAVEKDVGKSFEGTFIVHNEAILQAVAVATEVVAWVTDG